jgi:hypothetical protein
MVKNFIFSIVIIHLSLCFCNGQDREIVWKETVGTLDPSGYHEGTIYYLVDGQIHHAIFKHKNDRSVKNEKYTMRYNVDNPNDVQIDFWHPVYDSGETTVLTKATVIKVNGKTSIFHPNPTVRYVIDGETTVRWVYLPRNYTQLYPNLQSKHFYEVERWSEDLNRVVIHLDKPITSKHFSN